MLVGSSIPLCHGFALHLLVMDMQLVEPAYSRIFKKLGREGESWRDLYL